MVAGALVGMALMQCIVSCTLSMLLRHVKRSAVLGKLKHSIHWMERKIVAKQPLTHMIIGISGYELQPAFRECHEKLLFTQKNIHLFCSGCIFLPSLFAIGSIPLETVTR